MIGPLKTIQVLVKPGSREESLELLPDGTWVARVKAPPVDGKANAALVALIAARFGAPKSAVSVKAGAAGRRKLVQIRA